MSKVMRTHTGITEWNGDFWCDSCGKRVRGITTVNGMDFCAKCYQETFGETEKDRKITDLQSQLAEKVEEIERLKIYDEYRFELPYPKVKILGKTFEDIQELLDKWVKEGSKDKTSFCIEQLEKVKESFDKRNNGVRQAHYSTEYKDGYSGCCCDIEEQIDQQIVELKKGEEIV